MTQRRPLKTPKDQFNALHAALAKARSNTQSISVPRDALENLLADHATMAARYAMED